MFGRVLMASTMFFTPILVILWPLKEISISRISKDFFTRESEKIFSKPSNFPRHGSNNSTLHQKQPRNYSKFLQRQFNNLLEKIKSKIFQQDKAFYHQAKTFYAVIRNLFAPNNMLNNLSNNQILTLSKKVLESLTKHFLSDFGLIFLFLHQLSSIYFIINSGFQISEFLLFKIKTNSF